MTSSNNDSHLGEGIITEEETKREHSIAEEASACDIGETDNVSKRSIGKENCHERIDSNRDRNRNSSNKKRSGRTVTAEEPIHSEVSLVTRISSTSVLAYGSQSIIDLFVPIIICMSVVVLTINSVTFYTENDMYSAYTPFHEKSEDPIVKMGESIANALILLSILVCGTLLLLVLFIYEFYKILQGWMYLATFIMLFGFALLYLRALLIAYNVPMDYFTLLMFMWNFVVIGMICIHWKGPLIVQQVYMIIISALFALMLIKYLPDWTTWTVLVVVALWDLVAVLCPKGPLKVLLETAYDRDKDVFPALIYSSTMIWNITMAGPRAASETDAVRPAPVVISEARPSRETSGSIATGIPALTLQAPTQDLDAAFLEYQKILERSRRASYEKSDGVMLGLGDFIFYSILVGKASASGDWNTTLACFVAVLIGLAITLLMLVVARKALPALPVSICFGVVFYLCTSQFVKPFMDECAVNQVFI